MGKSKALKKWAKKHGYKVKKLKAVKTKPADMLGYAMPGRPGIGKSEWFQPQGLVLLDEYGQAKKKVRKAFAKMIKKGQL